MAWCAMARIRPCSALLVAQAGVAVLEAHQNLLACVAEACCGVVWADGGLEGVSCYSGGGVVVVDCAAAAAAVAEPSSSLLLQQHNT